MQLNSFYSQLIGAHMSIAGGYHEALLQGRQLCCTAVQLFLKNNRQWQSPKISFNQIELFKQTQIKTNIFPIAHASYLINMASPRKEIEQKSLQNLKFELELCGQLNIPYLILHPGSHLDDTIENGIKRIINNINNIFNEKEYACTLLLETMAGQGSTLGKTFEQLGSILNDIQQKNKIGICLDTCHIFAAGYKFNTLENYKHMWQNFDKIIGYKKLKVIHINNSKKDCGSLIDRHEHLAKGLISLEAFNLLLNDQQLKHIPKILETPKDYGLVSDHQNLEVIKQLLKKP